MRLGSTNRRADVALHQELTSMQALRGFGDQVDLKSIAGAIKTKTR